MQYYLLSSGRLNDLQTWTPSAITVVNTDTTTFGCLRPRNPVRRVCRQIVTHRVTQLCWVALTCVSTAAALAVQPRYDMGGDAYAALFGVQVVCVAFYWLRMLAEVVASGLVEGPHSFLRSVWNWLEVVVNIFAILQLIPPTSHIRWMRAFAAARPLRFFVFAPWWRQLLVPMARGTPYIFDIFFIFILATFAFALIGVYAIGPELHQRCFITAVTGVESVYASLPLPHLLANVTTPCGTGFACPSVGSDVTVACLSDGAVYGSPFFNFQNLGTGFLRMLKVASLDMWHEELEEVMNVKGSGAALYPVALVMVSQFLKVVAMTVMYNAYANLDTWFVRSTATRNAAEERPRKDCGVQSVSLRQQQQQNHPHPLRHVSSGRRAGNTVHSSSTDVDGNDDLSDAPPTLTAFAAAQTGAAVDQRYDRDFVRRLRGRGLWSAVRNMELTTTAGIGKRPRVPWAAGLVDSLASVLLMLLLSVGNLVLLAIAPGSPRQGVATHIHRASSIMAIVFLLPVALKLVGFGVQRTLRDAWNFVDVLGAVTGILELAAPAIFAYRMVGLLRVLRCVHAVKYVFSFEQYHYELLCLLQLAMLVVAILLLYALLGMQLFATAYVAHEGAPITNGDFTTMWTALLACVRAFTGDLWTRYLDVVSRGSSVATGAIFFVTLQAFTKIVLFGLENAILFRGFRDAARDEDQLNRKDFPPLLLLPPVKEGGAAGESPHAHSSAATVPSKGRVEEENYAAVTRRRRLRHTHNPLGLCSTLALEAQGDAFCFISPQHPLRRALLCFFGSFFYFALSTIWVVAGTVALFFERGDASSTRSSALHVFNIVYFAIFTAEMVAKWVAYGVFSPAARQLEDSDGSSVRAMPAYFREPLNWIDFVANGSALAGIAYPPLRIGRVLRTVRLCTTQERPNATFLTLVVSLRYVARTVPLICALYVVFAVTGVQIFSKGLYYCNDRSISTEEACVGVYNATTTTYVGTTTVEVSRVWQRSAFHYDSFGPALLSVFAMTSVTHYSTFMDEAMAIVGEHKAMAYNHSGYMAVFFTVSIIVLRFYAARCVAALLAAKLRRSTMASMGTALLTMPQTRFLVSRESIAYMLNLHSYLAPLPHRLSRLCHRALTAVRADGTEPVFHSALTVVVFVVCAFVCATHVNAAPWQETMLLAVECVGVAACGVEVLLGVVAYGLSYFRQPPRLFDVVLFALVVVGVSSTTLRFFRVAFLVKLMTCTNVGMQLLPAVRHAGLLCSACAVYVWVLFAYAVVGTLVFGDVAPHGAYLTEKRNFSTVLGSLLVLFDCSTMDQWHSVMYACFDGAACRSDASATCGHTYSAVPFFVTFTVLVNFVAVQLVFAAMVNAFTVPLYVDVIQPFLQVRQVWVKHAGAANLTCDVDLFLRFLPELPASLTEGMTSEKGGEASVMAFLTSLRLPLDDQLRLTYQDLMRGLAYRKYKVDLVDSGSDAHRTATLLSITVGEHYGQLLRRRYCDDVTALANATVEAVVLSDTAELSPTQSQRDGVAGHEALAVQPDDYAVPRGAFPLPTSRVFLYAFPGENSERAA